MLVHTLYAGFLLTVTNKPRERKPFLTGEGKLKEAGDDHVANVTVMVASGRNSQWSLTRVGDTADGPETRAEYRGERMNEAMYPIVYIRDQTVAATLPSGSSSHICSSECVFLRIHQCIRSWWAVRMLMFHSSTPLCL